MAVRAVTLRHVAVGTPWRPTPGHARRCRLPGRAALEAPLACRWQPRCTAAFPQLVWPASGLRRFCSEYEGGRSQQKLDAFVELLDDPDYVQISGRDARKQFGLTRQDLSHLEESMLKECPFEADGTRTMPQYSLQDVVALALERYGRAQVIDHHRRYLDLGAKTARASIYGGFTLPSGSKPRWYSAPSSQTLEGRQSLRQGLISNLAICGVKTGVWLWTGSHAVFADLMHTSADVANYVYRLAYLSRSAMQRDLSQPYGYSPIRVITADRSFVILGVLGCVVPLITAVSEVGSCSTLTPDPFSLCVSSFLFVTSMGLEGLAMRTAYREIMSQAAARPPKALTTAPPWRQCLTYLCEGRDVMSVATFCEAGSGVLGAMIGLCGIGLSWGLQTNICDIGASAFMALTVGGVSIFLLGRSGELLLGQTLPIGRVESIVKLMETRHAIVAVFDVKTIVIGTDTVRFKAEVQFNPEAVTEDILGTRGEDDDVSDPKNIEGRLQSKLQAMLPRLSQGFASSLDAETWLCQNNAIFYEALARELKDVERNIREELKDFRHVHIDLEPW